jgi:hypothetical protein
MNLGRLSSAALFASGIGAIVVPEQVLNALDMSSSSSRGVTEARVGFGGTFAALGGYALFSRAPAAQRAVGATWLGAGLVRLATRKVDRPREDWTYWAFLAGELGLGSMALLSSVKRRR